MYKSYCTAPAQRVVGWSRCWAPKIICNKGWNNILCLFLPWGLYDCILHLIQGYKILAQFQHKMSTLSGAHKFSWRHESMLWALEIGEIPLDYPLENTRFYLPGYLIIIPIFSLLLSKMALISLGLRKLWNCVACLVPKTWPCASKRVCGLLKVCAINVDTLGTGLSNWK